MRQDDVQHRLHATQSELLSALSQYRQSRGIGADQHEVARLELIAILDDAFSEDDRGAIELMQDAIGSAGGNDEHTELRHAIEAAAQSTWLNSENDARLEGRLFVIPVHVWGGAGASEEVRAEDETLDDMTQSLLHDGIFNKDATVIMASRLYHLRDLECEDMLAVNRYLRGLCQSHWQELGRPSTWAFGEPADTGGTAVRLGFFVGAVVDHADPFEHMPANKNAAEARTKWQKNFGKILGRLMLRSGYEALVKPGLPMPYFEGIRHGAALLHAQQGPV